MPHPRNRWRCALGLAMAVILAAAVSAQERSVTVTARQFLAEYRVNEIAADQKYKNKPIVTRGVIRRVADSDDRGTYMVWLAPIPHKDEKPPPDNDSNVIARYFTRGKKGDLINLAVGQVITVRGRCRGGGPALDSCSVLSR